MSTKQSPLHEPLRGSVPAPAASWELPVHEAHRLNARRTPFALVVPVWNEGGRILRQLQTLVDMGSLADVILADGGSTDGSTEPSRLRSLGVALLLKTDERGLGTALRMGLAEALRQGYRGVVTVDGNGKDGLEALPLFLDLLEQGFDFVQGSRFLKAGSHRHTPLLRLIAMRLVGAPLISLAARRRYTDPTNGFKALSARYLLDPGLLPFRSGFVSFSLQFYLNKWPKRLGYKVIEIPVRRDYPSVGRTPTKIVGASSHVRLILDLLCVLLGRYDV